MRKIARAGAKEPDAAKLAELKENAKGILSELRRNMIYRYPFCGSVSMSMDLVPTHDIRLPTAATDGTSIYFDIDFLSSLKPDEQQFVFCHEVWHTIMLHLVRCEGRDPEIFNIATDIEVNQLLRKDGMVPAPGACLPEGFNVPPDLSAEEYYALLEKKLPKSEKKTLSVTDSSNASGNGRSKSCPGNGSGNADGKLDGQFDVHIYEGDDLPEDGFAGLEDKYGKLGIDPDFCPKAERKTVEKIRETAISVAQQIERSQGTLPAHIQRIVGGLLEPEVKWQELLAKFITRAHLGDTRVWTPPNRRHVYKKLYLQSRRGSKLKIAVGIDTSGSTAGDIPKFLAEVDSLARSFGQYEIHYVECDAEVGRYEIYDDSNPIDVTTDFKVTGGGGTLLKPIFDKLEYEQAEVDCCVVFTDAYCEQFRPEDAPPYPVLWVVCKNGATDFSHLGFGEVLKLKHDLK